MAYINNNRVFTIMKVEPVPLTTLLRVGDNLRGKTVYFDTSKKFVGDYSKLIMTNHQTGVGFDDYIGSSIADVNKMGYVNSFASEGGADTVFIQNFTDENGDWLMDHYTFPDDADIVITSITTSTFWNNYIKLAISVDSALSTTSENPVQNKVITKAINDLSDGITSLNDTKANKSDLQNGTLVVAKSLETKAIENISEESGTVQEDPFIFQGTGTNNNTSETPTSPVAKQLEKRGNSVVVNQYLRNASATTNTYHNVIVDYNQSTMELHIHGTADADISIQALNVFITMSEPIPVGHKCLITGISAIKNTGLTIGFYDGGYSTTGDYIITNTNASSHQPYFSLANGTTVDVKIKLRFIDLTQWFGSNDNIPQDLLDNPSHFSWYYNGSLAYNTGELKNSKGRYLVCGGRNVWDEQWEVGYINQTNGENQSANDAMRSKNFIVVIPNKMYYLFAPNHNNSSNRIRVYFYDKDKNFIFSDGLDNLYSGNDYGKGYFIVPSNAIYIRFTTANLSTPVIYHNDITISLYYETGDGYDQYYPYEAPAVYDTGNEELLAFDTKDPNGTIHRNTVEFDLKELTWTYESENKQFYSEIVFDSNYRSTDVKCNKYEQYDYDGIGLATPHTRGIIGGRIYIIDESLNGEGTAITGIMQCKTDTPITEQGTPFAENIEINDYGTMAWLYDTGLDEEYVTIPQGCKIFYPADYVLLLDDLNSYTDGDVTKLAKKTDLATDKAELETKDTQLLNAIGGTLRQCLCVKESLDFNNTDFVDLGSLSWTYSNDYAYFYASISTGKNSAKILSTMYNNGGVNSTRSDMATAPNLTLYARNEAQAYLIIFAKNTSYSNATTFKVAMKGVLLAYEKA